MKKKPAVWITKASGEKEPFDESRLRKSLEKSQAPPTAINAVVKSVNAMLYEGMPTRDIYSMAFKMLKKESRCSAARYKLKNAILELGPAGYAFEVLVSEILRAENYHTQTGEIVQGKCVAHEVDVLAERGKVRCMIECKFHGKKGNKSSVKTPLYIQARFEDVKAAWQRNLQHKDKQFEGWVVTNTRFTLDAEEYGACTGLRLISWDKPAGNSLRERIDRSGLHPLTSLTSISRAEKKQLLDMDIVLCSQLLARPELLRKIGVSERRLKRIRQDLEQLCAH